MRIRIMLASQGMAFSSYAQAPASPQASMMSNTDMVYQFAQILAGLLVVVLFIFALAWIIKRFKLNVFVQGPIRTLAVTQLSHSSKMMLVELEGQQYLLGVTQQHVNLIDKLEHPVTCLPESFADRLKQAQNPS